jgi:DNA-binding CsgD family transcriptional regulator
MEEAFKRAGRQVWLDMPEDLKRELQRQAEIVRSPMYQEYWDATKQAMDGDEGPLRAWAHKHTGARPDGVLRVLLSQHEVGDLTPRETWAVVAARSARIKKKAKALDSKKRVPKVRSSAKKYPSLAAALRALALEDQHSEQVLLEMFLPGIYESAPHVPDDVLAGEIANQIRWEAFERPDAHKMAGELAELAKFANREINLKRGRDAGLPPREYELYKFFVDNLGSTNVQAAQTLGIAVGTVKSLKHRIKNTAV